MRAIVCTGYECHSCGKTVQQNGSAQQRCTECAKESHRLSKAVTNAAWRNANREKARRGSRAWRKANPEHVSVCNYHYTTRYRKSHEGMDFFSEWNPDKGGSYKAGAEWIITNLGKRPNYASLHMIDRDLGFVPDNLEWRSKKLKVHR